MDRLCAACGVTIASNECNHIHRFDDGRILMGGYAWLRLTNELQRLRTLEGSMQDLLEGG